MPSDSQTLSEEILNLRRAVQTHIETSQLFGEDEIFGSSKEARLNALYTRYANCRNCPLSKSRNKIVFGMGSVNPEVLFIGEGPGYEEDRRGLPFVGRAGELLDKILAAISLSRQTVYIANVVKCHPMKNPRRPDLRGNDRPPEPPEMEACRPILEEQIEILNPPLICALGSTSAKALLRTEDGITKLRGRVFDFQFPKSGKIIPLIPTYHPAALLRNEILKKDVWRDMKLLKTLIKTKP